MKLIQINERIKEEMPKTMFAAEELSTFIRRAVMICVLATLLNGVAIFISNCSARKQNKEMQAQIAANRATMTGLNTTVEQDITADQAWRDQFSLANPHIITPKVVQPTPQPTPQPTYEHGVVVVGKPIVRPPAVIVLPAPAPIIKHEVVVKRVSSRPRKTPTPRPWFSWGPRSKTTR